MPTQTTFSTGEVCKIAGVTPKRLGMWLDRAIVAAKRPGQGRSRYFRRDEILTIALINRLTGLGVSPLRAAAIAAEHAGKPGLLTIDANGAATLRPHEAFDVQAAVAIVDLGTLQSEIDQRLAA